MRKAKQPKKIGQPASNGSFGMPKAGRGLDALNNIFRKVKGH